jgi:Uma2 family endonuclease
MSTERSSRSEHRHDSLFSAVFAHPGPWSEEDYLALPEVPARIELLGGVLAVNALPDPPHQRLVRHVGNALDEACPAGEWEVFPGLNVRLWRDHVRIPDIVVARAGVATRLVPASDVLLLGEITSPSNFRQDLIVKHGEYAEAGVPFYLRIDLHKGVDELTASAFELVDGAYREFASAPDGLLRLPRPWPVEADLRALARGRSA